MNCVRSRILVLLELPYPILTLPNQTPFEFQHFYNQNTTLQEKKYWDEDREKSFTKVEIILQILL